LSRWLFLMRNLVGSTLLLEHQYRPRRMSGVRGPWRRRKLAVLVPLTLVGSRGAGRGRHARVRRVHADGGHLRVMITVRRLVHVGI
jgi:hypothetical protein